MGASLRANKTPKWTNRSWHLELASERGRWTSWLTALAFLLAGCTIGTNNTQGSAPPTSSQKGTHGTGAKSEVKCPFSYALTQVTQSNTGAISGCYRIPPANPGPLTLAIESGPNFKSSINTTGSSQPKVALDKPKNPVIAGKSITIFGSYVGSTPSGHLPRHATACWGGCSSGLHEDAVPVTQLGGGRFSFVLLTPGAPWVQGNGVHSLVSGSYRISLTCLSYYSRGCEYGPAQGGVRVDLRVIHPMMCSKGCSKLTASPGEALPGEVVKITGFSPVYEIIGNNPVAPNLTAFPGKESVQIPTVSTFAKPYATETILAKTTLTVKKGTSWSDLKAITGPSSIGIPDQNTIASISGSPGITAYCSQTGLMISTDSAKTWTKSPLNGIAGVIQSQRLSPLAFQPPNCYQVALEPGYSASLFTAFPVTPFSQPAPPVYLDPLYSTDSGLNWKSVPIPNGLTPIDFSAFINRGSEIEAYFTRPNSIVGTIETTINGGQTWTNSAPKCPITGPCIAIEPTIPGNCAMNGMPTNLVYSLNHGLTWGKAMWPYSINICNFAEIVPLGPKSALLIAGESNYPLRVTYDSGVTWSYVSLPQLPGSDTAILGANQPLYLLPNGSLLSYGSKWMLLTPGSKSWCIPKATIAGSNSFIFAAPKVNFGHFEWISSSPQSTFESLPLSKLTCRS